MTTKFLTEQQTVEEILELFEKAQQIKCAVAFWGNGSPQQLGLVDSDKPVKIICNLSSGATNPTAIQQLRANDNITVRNHSRLHAKIYWTEIGAIVGSANASANGLNFEDNELRGWKEASVLVTDKSILAEIKAWFDDLWLQTEPISETYLQEMEIVWQNRRNWRPPDELSANKESLLAALREDPDSFRDRKIYITIYGQSNSKEAEAAFNEVFGSNTVHLAKRVSYYEDWDNLPDNIHIVSLYYGPRGGFKCEGLWYISEPALEIPIRYKDGSQSQITVCSKLEDYLGLKIDSHDENLLKSKVKYLLESKVARKVAGYSDAAIICLYDARGILFDDARE